MSKRHVQWLYEELPNLVGNGVITTEAADKLRAHYGPAVKQDNRRLLVTLFSVMGAVLIGGGITLLLAHNWEELTRPARAVISFVPLLVSQALAGWVLLKRRDSAAWREGVGAIWTLAIGISIALIAQTYNLGGDFGDFMLTWVLLAAPIIYLLRSNITTALYWAGVTTWMTHARMTHGHELWFWLLMLPAVPYLLMLARRDRYGAPVSWLMWVLAICVATGAGVGLVDEMSDYWILVYASLFTVYWLAGRHWFPEARGLWQKPLQSIGGAGMMVLAVMLTFKWPWEELTREATWHFDQHGSPLFWWRLAVAALWPVAAMCLWGPALKRRDGAGIVAGLMPVLAAWGFLPKADRAFALPLAFDVYLLATGIATVVAGVRERQMGVVNGGMLILSALILARFFDSDLDFVVRGLVFVVVGAGFLVANLWLVKRVKVAQ